MPAPTLVANGMNLVLQIASDDLYFKRVNDQPRDRARNRSRRAKREGMDARAPGRRDDYDQTGSAENGHRAHRAIRENVDDESGHDCLSCHRARSPVRPFWRARYAARRDSVARVSHPHFCVPRIFTGKVTPSGESMTRSARARGVLLALALCAQAVIAQQTAALHHMGSIRRVIGLDAVFRACADQQEQRQTTRARLVLSGARRAGSPALQSAHRRQRHVRVGCARRRCCAGCGNRAKSCGCRRCARPSAAWRIGRAKTAPIVGSS